MAARRAGHAVLAVRALDRVRAAENTEVRVVQDDRALYFGIICDHANPKGIIALDMRARCAALERTDFNRLAGLDGNFWFSPSLKGEVLLAHTFSPAGVKSDSLGIGRLMFSKRDIVADVRYYAVGPDFVRRWGS